MSHTINLYLGDGETNTVINVFPGNPPPVTGADLSTILQRLESIMATQAEAAAQLATIAGTLDKVSGETTALLNEVQTLKDAAANAGNVTPELQAAIDAVASRAAAIDALVPDAPAA